MRKFRSERRENIRAQRRDAILLVVVTPAIAVISWVADDRLLQFFTAALFGALAMIILFGWLMGGHASALHWRWGAEGERMTAAKVEQLASDWHCEHDIEFGHGNWDHVLVGPPGVFLLDSKALNNPARVERDALRSGRLRFGGGTARSRAVAIHHELMKQLGDSLWVQAVVVVWGEFREEALTEKNVVYVRGDRLLPWLSGLDPKLGRPQRAAAVEALRVVRESRAPVEWNTQPMHARVDLEDKEAVQRALEEA